MNATQCLLALLVLILALPISAAETGHQLFTQRCVACHGPTGHGQASLSAPVIAGLRGRYVARQLRFFRDGIRGHHSEDIFGHQMAVGVKDLSDVAIKTLATHIESLPRPTTVDTLQPAADPRAGQTMWQHCVGCHGERAEGNAVFRAPRLTHQHSWYLVRQIENYRHHLRGHHPEDKFGATMAANVASVGDEQTMRNIVAWIETLHSAAEQ